VPTYEYECSAGHRYEKREGFDAPPTQRCAKCRRVARRVLHAASIVFKGSGFYVTDSRKPAPAGESESKTESSAMDKDTKKDSESTAAGKDTKKNTEATAPAKDRKKDAEASAAAG
jgi:putative FmdB family regulatory protein